MRHIFVSYSSKDEAIVQQIVKKLLERGLPLWIDVRNLVSGDDWEKSIRDAINHASVILVMMSPNASHSEWVMEETKTARQHNIAILPVVIDGNPTEILASIGDDYVDMRHVNETAINELIHKLDPIAA
jgi:hypothetical protein